jgi:hypothetical protein
MQNRRYRRIPFQAVVSIHSSGQYATGTLVDLAMKGALVACLSPLELSQGEEAKLCITLPDTPIALTFASKLVHVETGHYGFKFLGENLQTLTHLRKLIELNTGDVDATRDELSLWLHSEQPQSGRTDRDD